MRLIGKLRNACKTYTKGIVRPKSGGRKEQVYRLSLALLPIAVVLCLIASISTKQSLVWVVFALLLVVQLGVIANEAIRQKPSAAQLKRPTKRRKKVIRYRPIQLASSGVSAKIRAALDPRDVNGTVFRVTNPPKPKVSVVIPCFNDAWFLGAALESLQHQSIDDWECIVVDDASTDESFDVARAFSSRDPRFTVVRHLKNRGLAASRNTGTAFAAADLITFLDSDDFLYAQSLEKRLEQVTADPSCAGSYCDWISIREVAPYSEESGRAAQDRKPAHLFYSRWDTPFIATAPVIKKEIIENTGGFDESLDTAEDFDFFSRVLRAGYHFNYAKYVGMAYRQRSGSMIRRDPLGHLKTVEKTQNFYKEAWVDPPEWAPFPLTEPLDVYLREFEAMPRQLRFIAMAFGLGNVDQEELDSSTVPSQALRTVPDYDQMVEKEVKAALTRLSFGVDSEPVSRRNVEVLQAQLLDRFPQPAFKTPGQGVGLTQEWRERAAVLPGRINPKSVTALKGIDKLVFLTPQSRYHVAELGPLLLELESYGFNPKFVKTSSTSHHAVNEIARYTDEVFEYEPGDLAELDVSGAISLNDWDESVKELFVELKEKSGHSISKVEGVQDFEDVDTGRERRPYRHSDLVLAQGMNDVENLPGINTEIVGSSRLEAFFADPACAKQTGKVVVNFNFTYGVLDHQAEDWLLGVASTLQKTNEEYTISTHPAQKKFPDDPMVRDHIARDPFSHLLNGAGILISRFSTVIYEAMARGIPVIYHNPHGEKVPTFSNPEGAFLVSRSTDELETALVTAREWVPNYRDQSKEFFLRQVDIDPDASSSSRSGLAIARLLSDHA